MFQINVKRLCELMTEGELTLSSLSQKSEVSLLTLRKILNGGKVQLNTVRKLCEYFNVTFGELVIIAGDKI